MTPLTHIFVYLILCHQLADQPLQNTWITDAKRGNIQGCPAWLGLLYHAFMHAALVLLVTGSLTCFLAEVCSHYCIDKEKLQGVYGQKVDQLLHLVVKMLYITYLYCQGNHTL